MKMVGLLESQIFNYFLWIFFLLIFFDFELAFFKIVLISTFQFFFQNILTNLCIFLNIAFWMEKKNKIKKHLVF